MVKNLIKNSADLIFRRQTSILSAATLIAFAVLLSRILGLAKYRLLTDRFSVSDIGIFLAAFKLPNLLFDLIVMGALTTAFIPVFTSFLARGKEKEANEIASTVLNLSTVAFLIFSALVISLTHPILQFIAPGLTPSEIARVTPFTQIMIVGQALPLLLGNFLTGILQSHKRFLLPALAPVAYNLGIIIGIIFFAPTMGLLGAVWGVVFGAIFFFLVQLPLALHLKFHYQLKINLSHPGVLEIGKLFLPRVFSLGVNQLNYLFTFSISSLLSTRGITIFNFAQQLEQLPVAIFASTISQAALPTLSEEHERGDKLESFKKTFLASFHQILFLVMPAAAMLIVLRIPIVRLVYGASKFDWMATVDTGRTLAFLGLGLVAESATNLLVRGFFAIHDSKTPLYVGITTVALNIMLAFLFVPILHLPIWGLAAAVAIADIIYAALMLTIFHFKVNHFPLFDLVVPALKITISALLAGVSLYIPMKLLDQLVFDTTRTVPLIMLTGTAMTIGLSVYFFLTWVFEIKELSSFIDLTRKIGKVFFRAEETVSEVVSEVIPEGISENPREGR